MNSSAPSLFPSCNASHPWRPLGKILDLYVLPAVCLSGLFLNVACIVVFARRKTIVLYYAMNAMSTANVSGGSLLQSADGGSPPLPCKSSMALTTVGGQQITLSASRMRNISGTNGYNSIGSNGGGGNSLLKEVLSAEEQFITVRARHATRHSHPLVPVLIVLSVCDSLQLLFSLLVLYLPALHDHLEMDPLGCIAQLAYLATGCLAGGLLTANCASIWTICYISIQRHRAIVRPLSTITASKLSNKLSLCAIAVTALSFNLPVWFEFAWAVERVPMADGTVRRLIWHSRSNLAQNETYRFLMHKVLYPLCVYLIPLVLISVLNIRILTFIHSSPRVQSVGHRRRMEKERRSVWLLISIVLLFFLCHTGGLIIRFVDLRQYGNEQCFVFAKDLVNFLFNINSFANPMLYFFFTKQFRDLRTTWASSHHFRSSTTATNAVVAQKMRREKTRQKK
uniref:G-protein coupled receptors family 1 profile domain-containing protein n=1 Tax=Globodera rostochiensis TaxID=31243 RepID=A0A914I8R9_GLORO